MHAMTSDTKTENTRRPVIAQVLHRLYLAGAEVLAAALARELQDRYEFIFICLDEVGPLGHQLQSEGFTVLDLQRKPGVDFSVAKKLRQAIKTHGIDLLHPHQYTPFFYASLARGLSSSPPILFTEHGRHYPDVRKTKRIIANKVLLRHRDHMTACGQFSKDALVLNEGLPAKRIDVIYNGIDPEKFIPDTDGSRRAAMRQSLNLNNDQPVILQVARFHPVKDHTTSIRSMATVVNTVPDALLLLAGDGDDRAKAEALVAELNLVNNVRFLGVRKDVDQLIAVADVFILSSLSEAVSVTLLEAMGACLPIAATDVGGNGEVVLHNKTGLLSPRQDAVALGHNITTLLGDPAMRQRMGELGRARLLEVFRQDTMHEAYARLFEKMLGR